MGNEVSRAVLSEADFDEYPIWRFDEVTELQFPLIDLADEIYDLYDLEFRCTFRARNGVEIKGAVCGVDDIYFVRVFINGKTIRLNRNLEKDMRERVGILLRELPALQISNWRDLFPLEFDTNLNHPKVKDFSGKFELLK